MTNFLLKKAGLAFDEGKTRAALKKSTLALLMVMETKTNSAKAQRKKAAAGLQSGMSHQASMDVEQLIRQDLEIQAYDAIKIQCNQLTDRLRVLGSEKECPPGTKQAVCTLIWAAGKAEVPEELQVVKLQLIKKYGKDFATKALNNDNSCVNKLVAEKLLFQADPAPKLVEEYLEAIEKESNVTSTAQKVAAPRTRVPVARVLAPAAAAAAAAARAPTKRAIISNESPPEDSPMKNTSKPLIETSVESPRRKTCFETPEEETHKRTPSRESPEDETPKTAPTTTPSSSTTSPTAAKQTPPQFMKSVAAATAKHDAPESEAPVTPESLKEVPVSIRRAANAAAGAVRPIILA